jgi:hypothetical protein
MNVRVFYSRAEKRLTTLLSVAQTTLSLAIHLNDKCPLVALPHSSPPRLEHNLKKEKNGLAEGELFRPSLGFFLTDDYT